MITPVPCIPWVTVGVTLSSHVVTGVTFPGTVDTTALPTLSSIMPSFTFWWVRQEYRRVVCLKLAKI